MGIIDGKQERESYDIYTQSNIVRILKIEIVLRFNLSDNNYVFRYQIRFEINL